MATRNRERLLLVVAILCLAGLAGDRLIVTPCLHFWKYRAEEITRLNKTLSRGHLLLTREREIRERWPTIGGIILLQRIGRLAAGTPTVIIACSASHRDTGVFEATRYGIDRLKEIVPIWKKEVGPSGEEWVEGEYIPKRGD